MRTCIKHVSIALSFVLSSHVGATIAGRETFVYSEVQTAHLPLCAGVSRISRIWHDSWSLRFLHLHTPASSGSEVESPPHTKQHTSVASSHVLQ